MSIMAILAAYAGVQREPVVELAYAVLAAHIWRAASAWHFFKRTPFLDRAAILHI